MKVDDRLKLKVIACKVILRELYTIAAKSNNLIDIRWMKQELHLEPGSLQRQIQRVIDEIEADSEDYDAICLGFGLCSNGIVGLKTRHMKLVIPRAHDCISLLLGSRETYKRMFEESGGGIYWYSRGWMEAGVEPGNKKSMDKYNEYVEKYGEDNAKYLIEVESGWMDEYKAAAFIKWPEIDSAEFEEQARQTALERQLEYRTLDGNDTILSHMLDGDWNDKEFLVALPGQAVKASLFEDIIGV